MSRQLTGRKINFFFNPLKVLNTNWVFETAKRSINTGNTGFREVLQEFYSLADLT